MAKPDDKFQFPWRDYLHFVLMISGVILWSYFFGHRADAEAALASGAHWIDIAAMSAVGAIVHAMWALPRGAMLLKAAGTFVVVTVAFVLLDVATGPSASLAEAVAAPRVLILASLVGVVFAAAFAWAAKKRADRA
ncbi:hypothetical protein [Falsarthrobacter nasiphocae]|uniref:Uncharacterized protein n=1 Tax=Falsarthrobacter nasiphocae TaxID=189863 RepID=A0AAE4C5J6_9MICC|nr:hypothetical protein [Falsarthrobacter nasiphocae]MDR6892401.1 hypothetical protein [Falsarthrobacter nasiphocae]